MPYIIKFTSHAVRSFRKLPREVQARLSLSIDVLKENPRPPGSEKLKGTEDAYRIRVGDYRILYEVKEKDLIVYIIETGHRRDVYK